MVHSMTICSGTGHLHFSISESQVSFRLCVLLLNIQSGVWLIGEMVLEVICEIPFYNTYPYSCLFVQETGTGK